MLCQRVRTAQAPTRRRRRTPGTTATTDTSASSTTAATRVPPTASTLKPSFWSGVARGLRSLSYSQASPGCPFFIRRPWGHSGGLADFPLLGLRSQAWRFRSLRPSDPAETGDPQIPTGIAGAGSAPPSSSCPDHSGTRWIQVTGTSGSTRRRLGLRPPDQMVLPMGSRWSGGRSPAPTRKR